MAFQVEELSLQLVEALVPLMPRIKQRDKDLTGWILTLFPYLEGERTPEQNPHLAGWERALRAAESRTSWSFEPEGPSLGVLPGSIASAPVKFIDARDASEHPLRFVGGMFGVTQDQAGALAPEFGWGIVHDRRS